MFKFLSSKYLSRYFKVFLLTIDLIILNFSYLISIKLRYQDLDIIFREDFKIIWIFINVSWFLISISLELYKIIRIHEVEKIIGKYISIVFLHLLTLAFIIFILNFENFSRIRIAVFYGLFLSLILIFHITFLILLKNTRKKGFNNRNIVLLGHLDSQEGLLNFFKSNISLGYNLVDFSSNVELNDVKSKNVKVITELSDFLISASIHEVYICMHFDLMDRIKDIVNICEDRMIRIKVVPDFRFFTGSKHLELSFYNHTPVLMFRKESLQKARFRIIKRIFDLFFSLFALVFLVPIVFPIIALAIRMNSKGPIFYKQKRSGEDHVEFNCYKFRSMSVNNSPDLQASKNDSRITSVGGFLRKTSLDELPQFLNVLIGNMSVVGPRPHPLYMSEQYTEIVNGYMIRHLAKPGITGWAQVSGYRGETRELLAMQNRIKHDVYYIENWSFLLDLRIIWKTVFSLLKGQETAY